MMQRLRQRITWVGVLWTILTLLSLTLGSRAALAETYGDYTYDKIGKSKARITRYNGSASTVKIPNKIKGLTVVSIGNYAFQLSKMKSITIPATVYSISYNAFWKCSSLTSITLPEQLNQLGSCAFQECTALKSINIPTKVTSINGSLFYGCSGLTSITLPTTVTSIKDRAFYGCSSLESITIPTKVRSIGNNAFSGCGGLTSITIPDGVTSIGSNVFDGCSGLKSITIPTKVTSIGSAAFSGCSGLTSISIPDGVTSIGSNAFSGCSGLKSITIPTKVTSIGNNAFFGCSGLKSISIPDGVTSIGSNAFSGCSGLTSISISTKVTSIGSNAFFGCSGLKSISIPDGVTSIGSNAFSGCSGLKSISIPAKVTSISQQAFKDCSSLLKAYFASDLPSTLGAGIFDGTANGFAIYCKKAYKSKFKKASDLSNYTIRAFDLTVTYNGNGSTGGTAPKDNNIYEEDTQATVLANTGSLMKTGYVFNGWNAGAATKDTPDYRAGNKFTVSQDTTLYANWLPRPILSDVTPTIFKSGTAVSATSDSDGTIYLAQSNSYSSAGELAKAAVASTTVSAKVAVSLGTSGLTEGTYYLYVVSSSATLSEPTTITIDNTAPSAPTLDSVTGDSGSIASGGSTNATELTGSGTAEAESMVTLYNGMIKLGTATANASGKWSTTISLTTEGSYSLTATATDAAGNTGTASAGYALTIDTTAPTAPTVTGTTPTNDTTPSWSWKAGGDGNGTYRYKLDSNDLSTGATSTTVLSYTPGTALTEGSHTLYVQERDDAGNWSTSGSYAIVIDTTGPTAPTVTGTTPTNDTTPSWSWKAGGGGNGTYRYKLDSNDLSSGATKTTLTSYTAGSALTEGSHTLYVQESDNVGNWSANGTFEIVLDTTGPTAPTVTGTTPTNDITPSWSWKAGGGGNGIYRYKLDKEDLSSGATETTLTSYTSGSALTEGSHTLYVQERDAAGNWSTSGSYALTIDTTAPTAPTVTGTTPTNDTTPSWSWKAGGDGNGTYRYKLDSNDLSTGATSTTVSSYTPGTALTEGSHTLYVQERDDAGNWSTSGSYAIVIDTTGPTAPTVTGTTPTNDTTPSWSWKAGGGGNGTYRYKLDNSDLSSGATKTTLTSYTAGSALTEGSHTLYVQESDHVGNWSANGTFEIVIDTTGPTAPTVTGTTPTDDTTPSWSWKAGGGGNGTYRYKLDNSDLSSGATETTLTSYTAGSALTEGSHTLYVQERDAAGNWSTSGSYALTIDTTAPTAPTVTGTTPTNDTTPSWSWKAGSGGNGTYRYKLDNNDLSSGATSTTVLSYTPETALTEGSHTLYVQERDEAGNWSTSGSCAIVIDTTGPTAPTVTGTTPTNDTTPSWSWKAGGGGNGTYRYKLDNSDLSSGATKTTLTSYTAGSALTEGSHTLYVQESDHVGNWSVSGSFTIVVDTVAPTITTVTGPTAGKYMVEQDLDFKVTFNKAVSVTGKPYLALKLITTSGAVATLRRKTALLAAQATGSGIVNAMYWSGSGTNILTFRYTVAANDQDLDGIQVDDTITLNGGVIKDIAGNSAPSDALDFTPPDTSEVNVVTIAADKESLEATVTGNVLRITLNSEYYDILQVYLNGTQYNEKSTATDKDYDVTGNTDLNVTLPDTTGSYSITIVLYDLAGNSHTYSGYLYNVRVKYVPGRGDGFGWEMWKN
jgi:hypothetical protein